MNMSKLWEQIKSKITPVSKNSIISGGASIIDVVNNNNVTHTASINALINYAQHIDMPVDEFAKRLRKINKNKSKHLRYILGDIVHSAKRKLYDVIHNYKDKAGITNGYIYDAKTEACPICKEKHGTRWDKWADIPPTDMPLIHPNCNCNILPIGEDGEAFNKLTKKEWIASQTKEVISIIKKGATITKSTFKKIFAI